MIKEKYSRVMVDRNEQGDFKNLDSEFGFKNCSQSTNFKKKIKKLYEIPSDVIDC